MKIFAGIEDEKQVSEYHPFNSKVTALLYMLINSPKPLVRIEMVEPLIKDFNDLENKGLVTYDAYLGKSVLVIAPIICLICDNPRASELVNHLGATARHYCRMCMVSNYSKLIL